MSVLKYFLAPGAAACLPRVILALALLAALGAYALTSLWLDWPFALSLALALTCAALLMLAGQRLLSLWSGQSAPEFDLDAHVSRET